MAEKLDWFMSTVLRGEAEVTDVVRQVLADHAESYLRACSGAPPFSWSEWQLLSPESRRAFEEAAARIEEGKARRIAALVAEVLDRDEEEALPQGSGS